jgi:hypothetical protein
VKEACFCGWVGETAAKSRAYIGDGVWALVCPRCGRPDDLSWLPPAVRSEALARAPDIPPKPSLKEDLKSDS